MFFFFNDTATTEIYTLSLHDALPIWSVTGDARNGQGIWPARPRGVAPVPERGWQRSALDRVAAVDGNGGSRDEVGGGAREEDRDARHVGDGTPAAGRRAPGDAAGPARDRPPPPARWR